MLLVYGLIRALVLLKGPHLKNFECKKIASKHWLQLGGFSSYGDKGLHLKKFSGEPILIIEIFNTFLFIS